MNGLDQVVIILWFLPVMLFIIAPLFVGLVWKPISLFLNFIKREVTQERQFNAAIVEARSTA